MGSKEPQSVPRYEIFPPRLTHLVSVDSSCKKQEKKRFSCTLKDGHDRERNKNLEGPFFYEAVLMVCKSRVCIILRGTQCISGRVGWVE